MELSSTVWMVHARTGMDGVKGKIRLEPGRVVFEPEAAGRDASEFALSDVRRARRVLGSPVLEVQLADSSHPPIVGFYFVKPPSLDRGSRSPQLMRRRYARKIAVSQLRQWNAVKKEEISRWVEAIRESSKPGS